MSNTSSFTVSHRYQWCPNGNDVTKRRIRNSIIISRSWIDSRPSLSGVALLRGDVSCENLNRKSAHFRDKCPTRIEDVSRLIYSHEFFFLGRRGCRSNCPPFVFPNVRIPSTPPKRESPRNRFRLDFARDIWLRFRVKCFLSEILDDFFLSIFIDYSPVLSNNSVGRVWFK